MSIKEPRFIIIDDSKLDCFVAEKLILNTGKSGGVKSFLEARAGLEYIINSPLEECKTIIILDIQMPLMDGHGFVEAFEKLPQVIQNNYVIYMISSSTNEADLNRISNYTSVKRFFNKPVTTVLLLSFIIDVLENSNKIS